MSPSLEITASIEREVKSLPMTLLDGAIVDFHEKVFGQLDDIAVSSKFRITFDSLILSSNLAAKIFLSEIFFAELTYGY